MTNKGTKRERKRRQTDRAYREHYNEVRRAYYEKMRHDPEYLDKLRAKAARYRAKKQAAKKNESK